MKLANEIATQASVISNIMNKGLLMHPLASPSQQSHLEGSVLFYLGASPDSKEGVRAFLEKRDPKYTSVPSKDTPALYPWWTVPDMSPGKAKL